MRLLLLWKVYGGLFTWRWCHKLLLCRIYDWGFSSPCIKGCHICDLFSKEKGKKYKSGSYWRCLSLQPKAVEAWAWPWSHEFLLSRTLEFESMGDKNPIYFTHGLFEKLPSVLAVLPCINILRIFWHTLGTKRQSRERREENMVYNLGQVAGGGGEREMVLLLLLIVTEGAMRPFVFFDSLLWAKLGLRPTSWDDAGGSMQINAHSWGAWMAS